MDFGCIIRNYVESITTIKIYENRNSVLSLIKNQKLGSRTTVRGLERVAKKGTIIMTKEQWENSLCSEYKPDIIEEALRGFAANKEVSETEMMDAIDVAHSTLGVNLPVHGIGRTDSPPVKVYPLEV